MQEWKRIAAVFLGGAIGGLLRALISEGMGGWGKFPIDVLLINITGSFLLGVIQHTAFRRIRPDWLVVGLGTGVMGGFTTFSTFAKGSLPLFSQAPVLAFTYILATGLCGPAAAFGGQWLMATLTQATKRPTEEVSA